METDLNTFPSQTPTAPVSFQKPEELEYYCRLMGGEPGLFWSRLIYQTAKIPAKQEDFFQWGQYIGDALQIVNILRDLPKDLQIGRCYFPLEDLQAAGLTPADLLTPANGPRFEKVKQKWIEWGLDRLQNGISYFNCLPKWAFRQRAAVAWPILWAADTLNKLEQASNLLDPAVRVKISRTRIYGTMLITPFLLLSNHLFDGWLTSKLSARN